jgi:hypothetical protein
VWPARRPCPGPELAVDAGPGATLVSWPPRDTEGVARARRREPRPSGRFAHGPERWAGTS